MPKKGGVMASSGCKQPIRIIIGFLLACLLLIVCLSLATIVEPYLKKL